MLELTDLTVSYGPVAAVNGVSLRVAAGECVGLLGPNGAGKSSTLQAISNLVDHGGTVTFDGEDLRRRSPEQIARSGLIHVPEGRRIYPTLTVEENLQVGRTARAGRTGGFDIDAVYDLFPALRSLRERGGWALSGGEQQMVAIGRALVGAPRLLLLDEPSLGLAPVVAKTVFAALRTVAETTPVLVVEQNTALALRVCNRAAVLVGGQIRLDGTSAELLGRQDLLDSFLGQHDAHRPPESRDIGASPDVPSH